MLKLSLELGHNSPEKEKYSQEGGIMRSEGSTGPPGTMDRRDFLRLSGAGLAGLALLGATSELMAQTAPGRSLIAEFKEAAEKYDVPVVVLLAVGYVNTRLEMPPPAVSAYEPGNPHCP